MYTSKIAEWSADTKRFFDEAQDHSLVLEVIVSLCCKNQAGVEELVNAINNKEILRKIKKVNILDVTYLYRHFYNELSKYSDGSIASPWYVENKSTIEKLKTEVEIKSWADGINTKDFKNSYKQIIKEYTGETDGKGIDFDFRDTVTSEAAINAYKYRKDFRQCVDFILEKCAYLHSAFRNSGANIVYPMELCSVDDYVIKKHSLNIKHLSYRTSKDVNDAEKKAKQDENINNFPTTNTLRKSDIEAAVTNFMKNEVTNMNFFVVDKKGKLIYSNFSLEKLVRKKHSAIKIDKDAWMRTLEVIHSGKIFIGEEKARNERMYLSMKAPLRINGVIEGAIGLSIDITDTKRVEIEKKRASELEFLNQIQQIKIKFQKEFTQFISQMAHDITSPLASLEVFAKTCNNLPPEQQHVLTGITSSIKNIADDLLQKYKYNRRVLDYSKEQTVLVSLALSEVINQKKLQYNSTNVRINLSYDKTAKYVFINIDQSNFLRMISNLINNAIEACKGQEKPGVVGVRLKVDNNKAVIEVSDNGKGMPDKMINQIKLNIPVESTKQNGCGLGLCQMMETVRLYRGEINIVSKREKGTKFIIAFPLTEQPRWASKQIKLCKHNIVMVIDSDTEAFPKEWGKILKDNIEQTHLHFFKNSKTVNDFVDSLSREERDNVFVLMSYNPANSEDILNSVLQCGLMKQSVIITNAYHDKRLQEFVTMVDGKIVPMKFFKDIVIVFDER